MAKDFAGKWAWRFPQEEVPEGCHDEGCHPCDSTLASFAESPVNSGFQNTNILLCSSRSGTRICHNELEEARMVTCMQASQSAHKTIDIDIL